jgi:signal transduction histidine kinase
VRRRLLLSTLAAVGAVVLLLGLPLAIAVRSVLTQQALDDLQREAEQAQVLLEQAGGTGPQTAVLLSAIAQQSGSRLTLVDRRTGRGVVIDTGGPPHDDRFLAHTDDVRAAQRGEVGRVAADGLLAVTVPVRGGGVDQLVRVARTDEALVSAVRRAWLQIAALAAAALGVAALIAWWQGRELAAPLESLAASARQLGEGDFSVRAPRSGVPEPDDVAEALDATADRLAALVARNRSFSADASHQLRTPLTALRLHLEGLEAATGDPAPVRDALAEIDRLDATIEELLALGAPGTAPGPLDLEELVDERIGAWRAIARAQGRAVVLQSVPVPKVPVRPAAVGQSLQVLLDNALEHGDGTITVTLQPITGGVRLCVTDEGAGFPEGQDIPSRPADRSGLRGRGLPLARSLIEAEGGHLRVERPGAGARVCLLLPTTSEEAPSGP